jgi:hypothetical protein
MHGLLFLYLLTYCGNLQICQEVANLEKQSKPSAIGSVLIMGLCSRGPYRYAEQNVRNPNLNWMNWGYHEDYVHSDVLREIRLKKISQGTKVLFSLWDLKNEKHAKILRRGTLDHIAYRGGYVSFTVFLRELVSGSAEIPERDHYLCRFIEQKAVRVGETLE